MSCRGLALLLLLALVGVGSTGCLTRPIKQLVFDEGGTQIYLRSYKRGMTVVEQGYDHPATVAPVRMAHILSRIDLREGDGGDRKPAIPLSLLFTMADGMSQALEEADPNQQVVVQAIERKKSLILFDHPYLTSLAAYMRGDRLYIHISRSDWEVEKRREKATGLPETTVGEYPLDFRLIVDRGMTLYDHQSVVVDWRDDIFRRPTRTRVTPTGKVVRREVLMESFEDESVEIDTPSVSPDLSPEQLRALADLEEARQSGAVSEAEYGAQRDRILRGEPRAP